MGRNEFYFIHDKPKVPQTPTWSCYIGNWLCKSEVLERPELEVGERQLPASKW